MIGRISIKIYLGLAALVAVVIILAMGIRAELEARFWLNNGTAQQSSGDIPGAIQSFRRSESWFVPGFNTSQRAYSALLSIATDKNVEPSNRAEALAAAKRGLRASRSFIDALSRRQGELAAVQNLIESQVSQSEHNRSITETFPPRIRYPFQILAQCMFVGWIGTVFAGIWRAFGNTGTANRRCLFGFSALWLVFFIGWLVALRLA